METFSATGRLHPSHGLDSPERQAEYLAGLAAQSGGRFRAFGDMAWTRKKGWTNADLERLENTVSKPRQAMGCLFLCHCAPATDAGARRLRVEEKIAPGLDGGGRPMKRANHPAGGFNMPLPPRLRTFPNRRRLAAALAVHVAEAASAAFQARGRFWVALSGGSLMDILAPVLSAAPLQERIDWRAWHVFWTDERCVPPGSPDSNSGVARRLLLGRVGIPEGQIHAVGDCGSPDDSAHAYESEMRHILHVQPGAFPRFDLVLLGLGEDGHTASLFPGHPAVGECRRWAVPVFNAPKAPPVRVTLTLPVFNHARRVVFVAAGSSKARAVAEVLHPGRRRPILPAQMVRPVDGELLWFVDRAAAAGARIHSAAGGCLSPEGRPPESGASGPRRVV